MTQEQQNEKEQPKADKPVGVPTENSQPKPESSSEYEGAQSTEPTGNKGIEIKTETSSSSGE